MDQVNEMLEFEKKLKEARDILDNLTSIFNKKREEESTLKTFTLPNFVLNMIAEGEGYSIANILEKNRKTEYVHCRYMYYSILLETTNMTPREVGETLGYDRVTAMYGANVIKDLLSIKYKSVKNYEKYKQAAIDYRDSLDDKKGSFPKRIVDKV